MMGKSSISMGHLYHGYVSHNQMVAEMAGVYSINHEFMWVYDCFTQKIFGNHRSFPCFHSFCFLKMNQCTEKKTNSFLVHFLKLVSFLGV